LKKTHIIRFVLLASILLAGCAPVALTATTTPPIPTNTPFPTATPQLAPTSMQALITPEMTPESRAIIRAESLPIFSIPDRKSQPQDTQNQGEELEVVGQVEDCAWLKVRTAGGLEGWISGDNQDVRLSCKCSCLYEFSPRPENGAVILDNRANQGAGSLEIENISGDDGLVILAESETYSQILIAIYVRSAAATALSAIPHGSYQIFFSTGAGWSESKKQFQEYIQLRKFKSTFTFTNGSPPQQIILDPASDDAADIVQVETPQFPALE